MGAAAPPTRYWNSALRSHYDKVALTPLRGDYVRSAKVLGDARCTTTIIRQRQPLTACLKADAFEALLRPAASHLLPPRPAFAAWPSGGKRKANSLVSRKTELAERTHFRSYKVRLKPTAAQTTVLRRWFASARAHYNTAVDIINTTWDATDAEAAVDALLHERDDLTDGQADAFYWYQMFRADEIAGGNERLRFESGRGDAYYGDRELGLRQAVNEIISAEPRPELLAEGARPRDMRWAKAIPQHIADAAVRQALDALHTNLAKCTGGRRHHFQLRFRSLRNLSRTPTESLEVEATRSKPGARISGPISAITRPTEPLDNGRLPRTGASGRRRVDFLVHIATKSCMRGLGPMRAVDSAKVANWICGVGYTQHASEILWDKRTGRFYLILKRVVERPPDSKPLAECGVMGLDPGVRCFQAYSCPDGTHGSLLEGGAAVLKAHADACARAQSVVDRLKAGTMPTTRGTIAADVRRSNQAEAARVKRRTLEARARRRRVKATNWVKNAHYEAIKSAFSMADLVLVPVFKSKDMSAREARPFGSDTARAMMGWSHYQFMQRIWHKAQVVGDKRVAFVGEPGTTKTCDKCGVVCGSVGVAKVFRCCSCGHTAGRDVGHASRGNILAALGVAMGVGAQTTEEPSLSDSDGDDFADADGVSSS